jgi:cytoskeletal protein CcmA (bactofilin family)
VPTDTPEVPTVEVPSVEVPTVEVPKAPVAEMTSPPHFKMDEDISVSNASNDAFGMGGRVQLDGPVGDNAYILGGDVVIGEPVHGDLMVVGGSVRIEAPIDGDVYAVGGELTFTPDAIVGGHLTVGGGEVQMDGLVAGNVNVGAGRLDLGGRVNGDVSADAGELVFGEGAFIGGDLDYTSPNATSGADDVVSGLVSWTQGDAGELGEVRKSPSVIGSLVAWTLWTGWSYTSKLVVGVILLLLFGTAAGGVSRVMVDKPAQSLGYGVAGFLFLPLASLLAMALIIPMPLGFLGMSAFFILLYLSQLFAAQAIGDLILRRFRPDAWGAPMLSLAIGLIPLVLFSSLPWIGFLVWFMATVMGAGALWMRIRMKTTSKTPSKTPSTTAA